MNPRGSAPLTRRAGILLVLILTCVPVLRLEPADARYRLAVLAVVAVTTLAVFLKDGGLALQPRILPLGVSLVAVGTAANLRANDAYQWLAFGALVGIAGAGFVVGSSMARHDVVRPVFRWLIAIVTAQAAYAVYEAREGIDPLWRGATVDSATGRSTPLRSELIEGYFRAQATYGHPLVLASACLMAVVLVVTTDAVLKNSHRFLLVGVLSAGIVASGSRNAVIILAGVLLFVWGARNWRVTAARALFFGTPLAFIAVILLWDRIQEFIGTGSFYHRAGAFDVVTKLFERRDLVPLMVGDGSASTPRLQRQGVLQSATFVAIDNQFILLFIQYGLLGLGLVAALILLGFRSKDRGLRLVMAVWLVQFFVFDVLAWPSAAMLLWLAVGIGAYTAPTAVPESVEDRPVERPYAQRRR
ncbi:hypothetical protein [Rhodococcus sp. MEB041]|uniref:hypothetical protein n=1 Tax=Rhodococcus sp. MEB041 TaxID=3040323 RepID=UPI0025513C01|nr:hypothetical protein [Rhodococcus sp. MEB041]